MPRSHNENQSPQAVLIMFTVHPHLALKKLMKYFPPSNSLNCPFWDDENTRDRFKGC